MNSIQPARIALLLVLACAVEAQRNRRDEGPPPKLEHGSYEEQRFASAALDKEIPYGVYLPNGYGKPENAETKYPIVIWLHGMWEDHMRFHRRGGSQTLDELIGKGEVPELVLVCPSPGRNTFYINGKDSGRAEDLIVEDLVRHIDATYRVETDRGKRALMGVSMGGMAALRIAFKHPDAFGTVATHSAALFPVDLDKLSERFKRVMGHQYVAPMVKETFGDPIDAELWRASSPLALAATLPQEQLERLSIYFDAGTKDRYEFHQTNEALHEVLKDRGIEHTWRKIEDGGHSWGDGLAAHTLQDSFRFVARQFARASGQSALRGLLRAPAEAGGGKGEESSTGRKGG